MPHEFLPQDTSALPTVVALEPPVESPTALCLTPQILEREALKPETLEPLVRRFQQMNRLHRRRVRRAIGVGVGFAVVLMSVNLIALIVMLQTEQYPFAAMWWLWVVNVLVFAGCLLYPLNSAQARRTSVLALAAYEDVRVVGPLTELLDSSDRTLRKTARNALTRLLPRLTPADDGWLNGEQRDHLCQVLTAEAAARPELAAAILQAFAQVGDSHLLPHVERLAELPHTPRETRVREAARACLPLLRARVQHEKARQTLLRANARTADDPATLLRARGAEVSGFRDQVSGIYPPAGVEESGR